MQINKEAECETITKQIKKNQKDWIDHFNNKGELMISAPHIYRATNKEIIESLKKDFKESEILTSTRIIYEKNSLYAKIIHNADSTIVKPKKYKVKIPIFDGDFIQDSETEKYLQALFDTKDNIDKIIKEFKKFGKKKQFRLWTPNQSQRKSRPIRSVGLYFNLFDRFLVGGNSWFDDYDGLSRGVIIDSAKQSKVRRKSK